MADETPRYRFRGNVKPSAEVKRPVRVYRNADSTDVNGTKSTSATIDIFDVIDSWGGYWGISAAEVDQALAGLGDGVTTLYVRVNSPGGEATEGIAIANLIRAHAATVHVTNYGLAASAASVIAIAGDTLSMAPGSLLMIHKAWNYVRGNADDMRDEAAILDKFDQSLADTYALKGGTDTDWLALMGAETWMTPADAVAAGLADTVGIETGPPPANPDDQAEPMPDVDGDTPFDRAARVFDLTVFTRAPAAFAATPKPPAELPEKHPHIEEAVTMTETELKALREQFGLGDDADEATVTAAAVAAALKPADPPEVTDEQAVAALAKAKGVKPEDVTAALAKAGKDDEPTVPDGKVLVSQTMLDELQAGARDGAAARKKQREEERDATVDAAWRDGKISADRKDTWKAAWDMDPEGTKADLDSLGVRFPVAGTTGYAGSDGSDGDGVQPFSDDEADALAQLAGVSKEALING